MPLNQVVEELIKNCLEKDFTTCGQKEIPCDVKIKHLHCVHCPKVFSTPSSCRRHFKLGHLKRAATYKEHICLPCKINHDAYSALSQMQSHYHCPICKTTVLKQSRFFKHLQNHESSNLPTTDAMPVGAKHAHKQQDSGHNFKLLKQKSNCKEPENKEIESRYVPRSSTTRKCPVCNKILHKKSLVRHCRHVHNKVIQSTVCVDKKQGLFFVLRSNDKSEIGFRIHVKKVLEPYSRHYGVGCESVKCSQYMERCWKQGFKAAECQHLQEVYSIPFIPSPVNLSLDVLSKTFSIGDYNMFDKQRIEQCQLLHKQAVDQKVQPIVAVVDGKDIIHFSVYAAFTPTKFGRIAVVADFKKGVLECCCCDTKQDCIHKDICLWYLKQNDLLKIFVPDKVQPEQIMLKEEEKEKQLTVIVNEEMPTLISDIFNEFN